jgi:arylsulfatase
MLMILANAALIGCSCSKQEQRPGNSKPNIVIILADDLGFSDIGYFGGEIATPNIDILASQGMSFTQFYNAGRCCPSRASLLTGLYPHQAGVGGMVSPGNRPGYLGRLNENCATFANVLSQSGYQTFLSGKWHVTHYNYTDPKPTLHPETWPLQRGFDRFFGILAGGGSYFSPQSLMVDNEFIEPEKDFYFTDQINDHAVKFIQEADNDNPFLLFVSHVAPHWPLHALPEHINRFKGKYDMGWDELRELRYNKMIETGILDPNWPLTPRDERVPPWEDARNKEWEDHRMAVYAAQIYSMDQGIGRIMEALKNTSKYDNTLILFLSDNGGSSEIIGGIDTRHGYFERGGTTSEILPGGPDTYASYAVGWANASNTPFRLYKSWMHEGGISTPLIAHWPKEILPNQITHELGHVIDIMPTLIELSGAEYPSELNGNHLTPLEGISLLPVLKGEAKEQHKAIFWEHFGNKAIRVGEWKLVSADNGEWELYNMEKDRTEMNNLNEKFPGRVDEMIQMWKEWADKSNVDY